MVKAQTRWEVRGVSTIQNIYKNIKKKFLFSLEFNGKCFGWFCLVFNSHQADVESDAEAQRLASAILSVKDHSDP